MHSHTEPRAASISAEVSLVRGGPFYQAQQALRLIRPNRWNLGRRVTVLVAITWLPLVVITAISNPTALYSLLAEYRAYARLLIAIPALLLGELLMESRFRAVVAYLRQAGLLEAPDMAHMDRVISKVARLRRAFLPELLILLLAVVRTATSYRGLVDPTPWLGHGTGADFRLTAAGRYAILVSVPFWNYLLGLGLWNWLLWAYFAFELSRQNLKLVAGHPDNRGGLGFLGLTTSAFAPIAFAVTSVIGATWRHEILHQGAHLLDFKAPAIALAAIVGLVALGPLLFFVPRLAAVRRRGILEYGILGQLHSADFHEKWIQHRGGHEAEFLQAPESSTVNDYGQFYEKIEQLKPFPADVSSLYTLAAAIAIPALPAVLAQIPLAVVLGDLLKALR